MSRARVLADFVGGTSTISGNPTFTGTATGAGSEGLVNLETQETSTAVTDIKFGPDVFNTTYDRYRVFGRLYPATDNVYLGFLFLNNSESDITGSNYYYYNINNQATTNSAVGCVCGNVGAVSVTEAGVFFTANIWLPHVGSTNYQSMHFSQAHRVNASQIVATDASANHLRYDQVSTQPEGVKYYFSSGNISKALISVFAVTGG